MRSPPRLAVLLASLLLAPALARAADPDLGPNVLVFDPNTADAQAKLDAIFKRQAHNEFGPERYALLFRPGKYNLDVNVGFGTEVLGLGVSPDDTEITGAVRSMAALNNGNATCNFWRGVSNLAIVPNLATAKDVPADTDVWAVSQATYLRRVHVKGNLNLWDHGWSSGGFIADSVIDGTVNSGSQQQWISRNTQWGQWKGESWNMVFVGCTNPPEGEWPQHAFSVEPKTPVVREKPYLYIDANGSYLVRRPALSRDTQGVTWKSGETPGQSIPLSDFYIAHGDKDTAATMNAALAAGKHLLLTPGQYALDAPLHVARENTIVLGLGYPTLTETAGTPCITLDNAPGLTLSGVILDTGTTGEKKPTDLLIVGASPTDTPHPDNPIALHDIFTRAGGQTPGQATRFVTLNAPHTLGDNFWLWKADHGKGAGWGHNDVDTGLLVAAPDATLYGLFVEHTNQYQTLWTGDRGRLYFYQSEFPYDPPAQDAWQHDGKRGYATYKVADTVKSHRALGLGVYCIFVKAPVVCDSAFECPEAPNVKIEHAVAARFTGVKGSGTQHVLNDEGEDTITRKSARR